MGLPIKSTVGITMKLIKFAVMNSRRRKNNPPRSGYTRKVKNGYSTKTWSVH